MRYISSDTNVWVDFIAIDRLEYPFRLDYIYCMSRDAIEDELLAPKGRGRQLLDLGLEPVDIDDAELLLAITYRTRYMKLSAYDAIALAIAKAREIVLLTGDGALRNAAKSENVEVHGTLWILDQLKDTRKITTGDYRASLVRLQLVNRFEVRLPREEISKRLK